MKNQTLVALALAFLVLSHLMAGKLRFLDVLPRSRWLSFAGGISVAYAFIHLLPELSEHQEILQESANGILARLEHHAYLLALAGLATFYGLERAAKMSRKRQQATASADVTTGQVFWISISAFAVYNGLIGYLLARQADSGLLNLALYTLAMSLHFIVNDYGLHQHHKQAYARFGRWIVSGAVIIGAATGSLATISPPLLALVVAFLSGGIILNVLKEELPEERDSRFMPFVLGTIGYAGLLIVM